MASSTSSSSSSSHRKRNERSEDVDSSGRSDVAAASGTTSSRGRHSSASERKRRKKSHHDQDMGPSSETEVAACAKSDTDADTDRQRGGTPPADVDASESSYRNGESTLPAHSVSETSGADESTLPMQNSSISHVASQDVRRADPNDLEQVRVGAGEDEENAERRQVSSLLSHRRLLLERMRQCRRASETRLGKMERSRRRGRHESETRAQESSKIVPSTKDYVKKMSSSDIKPKTIGGKDGPDNDNTGADEDEVEEFRKMTRLAMGTMKRQKSEGGAGEKQGGSSTSRGTISLRRGSSVGKKMAAAVSTLTNTGGWVSDSSSSTAGGKAQQRPLHVGNGGNSSITPALPGQYPFSAAAAAGSTFPPNHLQTVTSSTASGVKTASSSKAGGGVKASQQSLSTAGMAETATDTTPYRKGSSAPKQGKHSSAAKAGSTKTSKSSSSNKQSSKTKQKKGSQKSARSSGVGPSSGSLPDHSSVPLHYSASNMASLGLGNEPSLDSSDQHMYQFSKLKPAVVFPEAKKLREQRKGIRKRLELLLMKQHNLNLGENESRSAMRGLNSVSPAVPSALQMQGKVGALSPDTSSSVKPFCKGVDAETPMQLNLRGPCPPVRLPPRRKTQWDYVLEEMRWLATDFVEERKWKVACSRTISCAIRTHARDAKAESKSPSLKPKPSPVEKILAAGRVGNGESDGVELVSLSGTKPEDRQNSEEDSRSAATTSTKNEAPRPLYQDPSPDDERCAIAVSKILSMAVTEHWAVVVEGGVFSSSDMRYARGYRKYRKLRRKHEGEIRQTIAKLPTAPDKPRSQSEGDNHESLGGGGRVNDRKLLRKPSDADSRESREDARTSAAGKSPVTLELPYGKISKRIDSSVDRVLRVKEEIEKATPPRKNRARTGEELLEGCGLELSPDQKNAFRFVEKIWADENTTDAEGGGNPSACAASVGSTLYGKRGSGKTITTGAIIWKHRARGPHMILCPSTSVIRWQHELSRFNDLNVYVVGFHGSSYDGASSNAKQYEAGDVLVCEFASFAAGGAIGTKTHNDAILAKFRGAFATITLDARYPCPAITAVGTALLSRMGVSATKKKRALVEKRQIGSLSDYAPPELNSTKWWETFLQFVAINSDAKRIMLEQPDFLQQLSPNASESIEDRQGNELLALKVAFLHHPSLFHSPKVAIGKRVLSWAKKRQYSLVKSASQSEDSTKMAGLKKLKNSVTTSGVAGVLKNVIHPFSHVHGINSIFDARNLKNIPIDSSKVRGGSAENLSGEDLFSFEWEIRFCPLPPAQRVAYDQCCYHSRGALSEIFASQRENSRRDADAMLTSDRVTVDRARRHANRLSVNALLQLRKVCLHSNLDNMLACSRSCHRQSGRSAFRCSGNVGISNRNGPLERSDLPNTSEPDRERAECILANSSKMKELLHILKDSGHQIAGERELITPGCMRNETGRKKSGEKLAKRKKLLILATLPEAQLLASVFLKAVGVPHEVMLVNASSSRCPSGLLQRSSRRLSNVALDTDDKFDESGADAVSAWLRCQLALAQFDSLDISSKRRSEARREAWSKNRRCDVIVSSPLSVASNYGGLSASAADLIVSLDEDWSGRGNLLLHSILTRHRSRHYEPEGSEKECTFIRLICENTCEDSFLKKDEMLWRSKPSDDSNKKSDTTEQSKAGEESETVRRSPRKGLRRGRSATPKKAKDEEKKKKKDLDKKDGKNDDEPSYPEHKTEFWLFRCPPFPANVDGHITSSPTTRVNLVSNGKAGRNEINTSQVLPHRASTSEFFLARNILRYRDSKLSSVLRTSQHLPPSFLTGLDLMFLPTGKASHTQDENAALLDGAKSTLSDTAGGVISDDNRAFGKVLVQAEASAAPTSKSMLLTHTSGSQDNTASLNVNSVAPKSTALQATSTTLLIAPPLPLDVPSSLMTRRDSTSLSSRRYVEGFGRLSLVYGLEFASANSAHSPLAASAHDGEATTSQVDGSNVEINLADALRKSGLGCKPESTAASLLVYSPRGAHAGEGITTSRENRHMAVSEEGRIEGAEMNGWSNETQISSGVKKKDNSLPSSSQQSLKRKRKSRSTGQASGEQGDVLSASSTMQATMTSHGPHSHALVPWKTKRTNYFSVTFSASDDARSSVVQDGNQGCEPLVYFPPLFPCLLQSTRDATRKINMLRTSVGKMTDVSMIPASPSASRFAIEEKATPLSTTTSKKRKAETYSTVAVHSGKRPRPSSVPSPSLKSTASSAQSSVLAPVPPTSSSSVASKAPRPGISHPSPSSIVSSSAAVALSHASSTAGSTATGYPVVPGSRFVSEDETSDGDAASLLLEVNDDFGLLGIGALPLPFESARAASMTLMETNPHSYWKDQYDPNSLDDDCHTNYLPCDTEEACASMKGVRSSMDSIILFVKKKPNTPSSMVPASSRFQLETKGIDGQVPTASSTLTFGLQRSTTATFGANSTSSSKKSSKKSGKSKHKAVVTHRADSTAFRRKDAVVTFRGFNLRGGLYDERGPIRKASVRLRHRLSDRVSQYFISMCASAGLGPGVPHLTMKEDALTGGAEHAWTSAVLKLIVPGGKIGDHAYSVSTSQRAALRRSLVSPCRVDFGPFQIGYLSLQDGMTNVSPPRTPVGITLPMGVKVPQQRRESSSLGGLGKELWSEGEDMKLKDCTGHFGFNWHLASRAVTGASGNSTSRFIPARTNVPHVLRSARQCRDRWQSLAKAEKNLSKDVCRSERAVREMASITPKRTRTTLGAIVQDDSLPPRPGFNSVEKTALAKYGEIPSTVEKTQKGKAGLLLLRSRAMPATFVDAKRDGLRESPGQIQNLTKNDPGRNRIALLKAAALKRQHVPITIPGASGSNPASLPLVPSHRSHAESVQAARASASGGIASARTEMWPLQLLDLADKQRAAASQRQPPGGAAGVAATSATTTHRVSPPQHPQQHRPQNVVPHHHQGTAVAASLQATEHQERVKQAARAAALAGTSPPNPRNVKGQSPPQQRGPTMMQQPPMGYVHPPPPGASLALPPAPPSSATPEVKAAALAAALGQPPKQRAAQKGGAAAKRSKPPF